MTVIITAQGGSIVFFWVTNKRRLKEFAFIIMAFIFMLTMVLTNRGITTPSGSLTVTADKNPPAISKVITNQKHVALTFDVAWGNEELPLILEELKKEDVRASFFVAGEWAEHHTGLVKEIAKDNHLIASHGYRHTDYTTLDENEVRRDIQLSLSALQKITGDRPDYLRPPESKFNEATLKIAQSMGEQVILWSQSPSDEENPGYKIIAKRVVKEIKPGAIIQLHASDSAKETFKALPLIIDTLKSEGYTFVTLTELLSNSKGSSRIE